MIEKGKDMITISGNSLLKSNHIFMLWIQSLCQQMVQLFFQKIPLMVWITIVSRSKLIFKFMSLSEHYPESNRPVNFVTCFQIFSFSFQVSRAELMRLYRGLKMSFPAIMNKYSFPGYSTHIFINSGRPTIGRSGNKSSAFILPCPKPILFTIDFHPRFVCADNPAVKYFPAYHFIAGNTFRCQPVQQTMQTPFTNLNRKDVIEHFLKSFEREVLSYTEIANKSFNIFTISHRTINTNREITFHNMTTCTLATINSVFRNYLFDSRDINNLSLSAKFERQTTHIFPALGTKTRMMFNNLIWRVSHLKRFAFMTWLSSCFTTTLLPKTARVWRSVLILRRWQRTITAVFFGGNTRKFLFKIIYFCFQQPVFSFQHLNDALQFYDDNVVRGIHILCCKANPDIHYFKERNRLFIKH